MRPRILVSLFLAVSPAGAAAAGASSDGWSIVASPNTSDANVNLVASVACASASDCWAVGSHFNGGRYQTLIERWDGTAWALEPAPNTSETQHNQLEAVTCVSSADCWAVGTTVAASRYQTLIERWDGTAWKIVPSANTGATLHNYLHDVTCVSVSDCWAVGSSGAEIHGNDQTMVQRWDGTAWSIVPTPSPSGTSDNFIQGVSCVSASDCWAVGFYDNGLGHKPLTMRWDGTSWGNVAAPSTGVDRTNFLRAVACVASDDCWAVGEHRDVDGIFRTLIERWDGSAWAIFASPNSPTHDNQLTDVTCASASACWAVGSYAPDASTSPSQTVIQRWDGASWSIVASPNTSASQHNFLEGVTCVSASGCWAVGSHATPGSPQRTLVLHYAGTALPATPVRAPQITDIAGDANGLALAGIEQDTRPASLDPADLRSVLMRTVSEAIPVGEDGIRYDPTGLAVHLRTTATPDVPDLPPEVPDGPSIYRLLATIDGHTVRLDASLLRRPDGTLDATAFVHLADGCGPGEGPCWRRSGPGWTAEVDAARSEVVLLFPFATLAPDELDLLGPGSTLGTPRGETILSYSTTTIQAAGEDLIVERGVLADNTRLGAGFRVGSDVPPDIPCTRGCP